MKLKSFFTLVFILGFLASAYTCGNDSKKDKDDKGKKGGYSIAIPIK